MGINFFDRKTKSICKELTYGASLIDILYRKDIGKLLRPFVTSKSFSRLIGKYQDTRLSTFSIKKFIENYKIEMEQFAPSDYHSYKTFNDFFIRPFKKGARVFDETPEVMPAFAEGRYLGYEKIRGGEHYPVKGKYLTPQILLNNTGWEKTFFNGPMLIARLAPVDYHRFHFPDSGVLLDDYHVNGKLHSVNPVALRVKEDILCTNERMVTIMKSKNFGHLAYIEVGATMVGKIVQSYDKEIVARGDEKGHFLFGGSTVILIGEEGRWVPSKDILEHTAKGLEVFVELGTPVASHFSR